MSTQMDEVWAAAVGQQYVIRGLIVEASYLTAARMLAFVAPVWLACGYGCKVEEIVAIIKREPAAEYVNSIAPDLIASIERMCKS